LGDRWINGGAWLSDINITIFSWERWQPGWTINFVLLNLGKNLMGALLNLFGSQSGWEKANSRPRK
jgi:hypothetical protein